MRTVITAFVPLPSPGTLCPTTFPNFAFTGTYEVVGGTGEFAAATGSGFVRALRENGPIHAVFVGTAGSE